jgi:hypothetical protein
MKTMSAREAKNAFGLMKDNLDKAIDAKEDEGVAA